jgi:hypothetical protein
MIFPVRAPSGGYRLAVADPSTTAAIRAAEIVFGASVDVVVASFEDITTLLDQRVSEIFQLTLELVVLPCLKVVHPLWCGGMSVPAAAALFLSGMNNRSRPSAVSLSKAGYARR